MKTSLLLAAAAAATLLQGCRTYQPGDASRRTLFGDDSPAPATARNAPAPRAAAQAPTARPAPVRTLDHPPVATRVPTPGARPGALPTGPATTPGPRPGPATAPTRDIVRTPPPGTPPAPSGTAYTMYTVQVGDVAGAIANKHGMTLAEFVKLNNLPDPNHLRVGQTVKVAVGRHALPPGPSPVAPAAPTQGVYIVKEGDSFSAIASRHHLTVPQLKALNPSVRDIDRIGVGTPIRVSPTASSAGPVASIHPVAPTSPVQLVKTTPPVQPVKTTPPVQPVNTTPPVQPVLPTRPVVTPTAPDTVTVGGTETKVDDIFEHGLVGARDDAEAKAREAREKAAKEAAEAEARAREEAKKAADAAADAARSAGDALSSDRKEYVVVEGDDLWGIADNFGTKPIILRALNPGKDIDDLQPGDRIFVPAN